MPNSQHEITFVWPLYSFVIIQLFSNRQDGISIDADFNVAIIFLCQKPPNAVDLKSYTWRLCHMLFM